MLLRLEGPKRRDVIDFFVRHFYGADPEGDVFLVVVLHPRRDPDGAEVFGRDVTPLPRRFEHVEGEREALPPVGLAVHEIEEHVVLVGIEVHEVDAGARDQLRLVGADAEAHRPELFELGGGHVDDETRILDSGDRRRHDDLERLARGRRGVADDRMTQRSPVLALGGDPRLVHAAATSLMKDFSTLPSAP